MNTLYIDRSTVLQTAAFVSGDGDVDFARFDALDARSGDWVPELWRFAGGRKIDRIVVGTGPGSFAGIRSALAFATGFSAGSGCEVLGIPSCAALARAGRKRAVVGDARRGKRWVAVYDGFEPQGGVCQTGSAGLAGVVPPDAEIVSPDHVRIGAELGNLFAGRYLGEMLPSADALAAAAAANPSLLSGRPSPIYLNPAVRED